MSSELERISSGLFGRAARLVVAAWVYERADPVFFQGEIATGCRLPQSNVTEELDRLVSMGMVADVPKHRGDRRRYYHGASHPLWDVIAAALDAARELSAATRTGDDADNATGETGGAIASKPRRPTSSARSLSARHSR